MITTRNGQAAAVPVSAPQHDRLSAVKPFLMPILITCILAAGQLQYRVLESYWYTATAILVSIAAETVLRRFVLGRWPHIASAYITGISVGILLRSPVVWPYIMCSLLSISSKYALRIGPRHLWNPSNLGVSILLFVVPIWVAPLSQQWGNDIWVPLIIMALGGLILYTLGRLHVTLTYMLAFLVLSAVRVGIQRGDWGIFASLFTSDEAWTAWVSQIALLTAPAYLLFMFFMITDPATTPRTRARRIAVTLVVAVVETLFRLGREIHAPYYALFVVFPVTNLLEILWDRWQARRAAPAAVQGTVVAVPAVVAPVSK